MLTFTHDITVQPTEVFSYPKENTIYFDIETTGFSPAISSLYLIGCIYYSNHQYQLIQWFADDYESEAAILYAFNTFIADYSNVVHYNGTHFDIPYLEHKYKKYNIDSPFSTKTSLDIYQEIRPYHGLFQTDNLKQKTLEQFLKQKRQDIYDGGQLIEVYNQYMQLKYKSLDNSAHLEALLLHNREDLSGLLSITALYTYTRLYDAEWLECIFKKEEDVIHIHIKNKYTFPVAFTKTAANGTIHFENDICNISIPVFKGTLKYFYPDYKNYYYLPVEDTAIHKSVAAFMDTAHRKKATASTCYQRKTGTFLSVFGITLDLPMFREDYKSPDNYIMCTDAFLSDGTLTELYVRELLKNINTIF